jgi:hypothetical protein
MEENLVEATRREITRNRELLDFYRTIPTGRFAEMMIEMKIENAIKVLSEGDVVEIMRAYEDLKSSE